MNIYYFYSCTQLVSSTSHSRSQYVLYQSTCIFFSFKQATTKKQHRALHTCIRLPQIAVASALYLRGASAHTRARTMLLGCWCAGAGSECWGGCSRQLVLRTTHSQYYTSYSSQLLLLLLLLRMAVPAPALDSSSSMLYIYYMYMLCTSCVHVA